MRGGSAIEVEPPDVGAAREQGLDGLGIESGRVQLAVVELEVEERELGRSLRRGLEEGADALDAVRGEEDLDPLRAGEPAERDGEALQRARVLVALGLLEEE